MIIHVSKILHFAVPETTIDVFGLSTSSFMDINYNIKKSIQLLNISLIVELFEYTLPYLSLLLFKDPKILNILEFIEFKGYDRHQISIS